MMPNDIFSPFQFDFQHNIILWIFSSVMSFLADHCIIYFNIFVGALEKSWALAYQHLKPLLNSELLQSQLKILVNWKHHIA